MVFWQSLFQLTDSFPQLQVPASTCNFPIYMMYQGMTAQKKQGIAKKIHNPFLLFGTLGANRTRDTRIRNPKY
jgi:hypothetical protein